MHNGVKETLAKVSASCVVIKGKRFSISVVLTYNSPVKSTHVDVNGSLVLTLKSGKVAVVTDTVHHQTCDTLHICTLTASRTTKCGFVCILAVLSWQYTRTDMK